MSIQVQEHPSVKVILPGVSGTGKTTLWEKLVRREEADFYFFFDHKQGDLSRRLGIAPCHTLSECLSAAKISGVVCFDPGKLYPGKPEQGFAAFCDFVWAFCQKEKGRKIFGCDELDWLIDARNCPDEFLAILDQGRTFQIDCFFITQAMNALHNGVRKQMTEIFAFKQGDSNGLIWLGENGFDTARLSALKPGEWVYKNLATGKTQEGGKAFELKNSGRDLSGL